MIRPDISERSALTAAVDDALRAHADLALDADVEQRGPPRRQRPLERRGELAGALDQLAVRAQAGGHEVVARRGEIGDDRLAVEAELDVLVDPPGRVVAE